MIATIDICDLITGFDKNPCVTWQPIAPSVLALQTSQKRSKGCDSEVAYFQPCARLWLKPLAGWNRLFNSLQELLLIIVTLSNLKWTRSCLPSLSDSWSHEAEFLASPLEEGLIALSSLGTRKGQGPVWHCKQCHRWEGTCLKLAWMWPTALRIPQGFPYEFSKSAFSILISDSTPIQEKSNYKLPACPQLQINCTWNRCLGFSLLSFFLPCRKVCGF